MFDQRGPKSSEFFMFCKRRQSPLPILGVPIIGDTRCLGHFHMPLQALKSTGAFAIAGTACKRRLSIWQREGLNGPRAITLQTSHVRVR